MNFYFSKLTTKIKTKSQTNHKSITKQHTKYQLHVYTIFSNLAQQETAVGEGRQSSQQHKPPT
jgi:hypothetical protein